jgi:AcrR family transcriptional regulator
MPQVLKDEVRQRIANAALAGFSKGGYAATTMNDIARAAGMAVANLYRYYPSKDELFAAVVPAAVVARFEALLEKSVRAHAPVIGAGRASSEGAGRELLDFWIEHRRVVVILLDRAQGSMHEQFPERFVSRLVALSIAELRANDPDLVVPREARLVLEQIFENTRRMIAKILESSDDERAIRRAVAAFRAYQVAGLAAFSRWLASEASE